MSPPPAVPNPDPSAPSPCEHSICAFQLSQLYWTVCDQKNTKNLQLQVQQLDNKIQNMKTELKIHKTWVTGIVAFFGLLVPVLLRVLGK